MLAIAERHGPVRAELRRRIAASGDAARLRALAVELGAAAGASAVEAILASLPEPAPTGPGH